jgi:hypothetical protein
MTGVALSLSLGLGGLAGCTREDENRLAPQTLEQVPGHDSIAQDSSHKEPPRLLPAEAYLRSYLMLFGGLTALQAQRELAMGPGLFDGWNAYLGALGLPNYAIDLPRGEKTNALMIATFERLGAALCDRAIEKDLKATPQVPVDKRLIYGFEVGKDPVDEAGFAPRFNTLHRRFLGYPAKLAPTDRVPRFYKLYRDVISQHDPKTSRLSAVEAGWAAVCQGLIRHPEFQLY